MVDSVFKKLESDVYEETTTSKRQFRIEDLDTELQIFKDRKKRIEDEITRLETIKEKVLKLK